VQWSTIWTTNHKNLQEGSRQPILLGTYVTAQHLPAVRVLPSIAAAAESRNTKGKPYVRLHHRLGAQQIREE
jgi:hypothetical protein